MTKVDDFAELQSNGPDPIAAAERLTVMLDLGSVGLEVRGARIVGNGMSATAYLFLSDGTTMTFETLRDFASPNKLAGELAIHTHATPVIKQPTATKALAYLSIIAEHERTATVDEVSSEWGLTFLQRATPFDVDMNDRAQRWAAFKHLEEVDRNLDKECRQFARSVVALVDSEGSRYVRTGWFREHVRQDDRAVSPQEIAQRMERVGWRRRGKEGRIKATSPGLRGQLVWPFYVVPAQWESIVLDTDEKGDTR